MPRVILDTVVFVRALINPFSICGRLVFAFGEHYHLVVSRPILVEILEVLNRPSLNEKFGTLAQLDRRQVLEVLSHADAVEVEEIPSICRDPADDKFLATAVAAQAAYLVSEDCDLLDLGTYGGTEIVSASRFIELLGLDQGR